MLDFIGLCRKAISIDSTSSAGNKNFVAFIDETVRDLGLYSEVENEIANGSEQANIIIRTQPQRPELEFMLQSHLDTSDPGAYQLWKHTESNPFESTIIDGKIYGIGTADAKLDFLCKLWALNESKSRKQWTIPPVLVGTFGKEDGMTGALKLIRKNKVCAKMALIGEPTELQVITSGLGYASVEIRIPFSAEELHYKKEHDLRESTSTESKLFTSATASRATDHDFSVSSEMKSEDEKNAIRKMFEHILKLPLDMALLEIDGGINPHSIATHALLEIDMVTLKSKTIISKIISIFNAIVKLENEFKNHQDNEFDSPLPALNIGMVRTSGDFVTISGNCRIPPNITQNTYEKWMSSLGQACKINESDLKILDYKKPFRTPSNSILVKACFDIMKKIRPSKSSEENPQGRNQVTANEASIFSRIGIECVCFGPGKKEGNVLTPDEHVALADLESAKDFYGQIMNRFC